METKSTQIFESMVNMQKQAMDSITNATEQMQKKLFSNNMIDSDFFKKWYDSQMSFFNQNADSKNISNPMEFFNTWMTNQMNTAKSWFDNMNTSSPFLKNINMNDDMKKNYEQMMNFFHNWSSSMNSSYSEMLKNFNNSNSKDTFSGMFNNAEMYMKAFELWMPMFKSIQDKSFTPETFKQMFNAPLFKDMMDKMFNMQPDFMKNMNEEAKANMYKMMDANKTMFDNFKGTFNSNIPDANTFFNQAFSNYNNLYSNFSNAVSPIMKLMPAGSTKQNMDAMNEMGNEFNVFNMKNSQMQYMMYATGLKSMEELSEKIYTKLRTGEELSSFLNIYTDWLHINDKNFISLFETEEYSKMQAELSSFGNKLKRNIDLMMEKSLANLPLINRTEMDDLYKTIYELKKRINVLEKQIDADSEVSTEIVSEVKPSKKSAKN